MRHCIVGIYYESQNGKAVAMYLNDLKTMVAWAIAKKALDPWCGICHSQTWTYEDEPTIFKTIAEAQGPMAMLELEQQQAAKLLKPSHN